MPTKKLALFVEGQTEFIFLRDFLGAIAGPVLRLRIEGIQINGNSIYSAFVRGYPPEDSLFQITLFNCESDGKVVSAIRERYSRLVADGFSTAIGLRDLHGDGRKYGDLKKLKDAIQAVLPSGPVDARAILAVMEIEAWFLKELGHLSRLNPKLTAEFIQTTFGVDLVHDDVEKISHPAGLLDEICKAVGARYRKQKDEVEALVSRLDFEKIYFDDRLHVSALNEFLTEIDFFLNAD